MERSIGVVEFRSIAIGIYSVDKLVKASDVKILDARTLCPGKYYVIFGGDVSAVNNSINAVREDSKSFIIDSVEIPNIYPEIFMGLSGTSEILKPGSIGIIETLTSPSVIWAADAAIKATDVDIVEVRIARALGGKNICVINGSHADVVESIRVGKSYADMNDFLVDSEVISAPHKDLYKVIF